MRRTDNHDGRIPMSHGRDVHPGVPLRFPVGRDVGTTTSFRWLEGEELFLNTLISGGKGKGKTAGIIKPFLRWVTCHPARCGALVLDVKGDLHDYIRGWAALAGRESDVIDINPRGENKIHLFPRGMHTEAMANAIVTATHTIAGGSDPRESFWISSAEALMSYIILLVRMEREDILSPISPSDILELVGQEDELSRRMNRIELRYEERRGQLSEEEEHNYDYLRQYYHRHNALDGRVRTSVEAEVYRMLKDFSGYHYKRVFCPSPKDRGTVSIGDILTEGRIVLLSMPQSEFGETSRFIGLMLKSQFYAAAMRRLRNSKMDEARPVFFVCDEYQNFATIGGRCGSDDNFAALCRQAKTGLVCATQELGALYAVAGQNNTEAVSNLIQNFQNHIVLQQTMTPRMAALLAGKGVKDVSSIPRLRAFEALFFKDTDPAPRLVELGPTFSSWDYASAIAQQEVTALAERKHAVLGVLGHPPGTQGLRTVIAGAPMSRKSSFLDGIYSQCVMKDIPCLRYNAKYDVPESVVERLADVCALDRRRMENSIVLVDDVDVISDDKAHPASRIYYALLPILSGSRTAYGKGNDQVDLSKVDVIMTATIRHRGHGQQGTEKGRVTLPGRVADGVTVVDIGTLIRVPEQEQERGKT